MTVLDTLLAALWHIDDSVRHTDDSVRITDGVLDTLPQAKADVNGRTETLDTPLHLAARLGNDKVSSHRVYFFIRKSSPPKNRQLSENHD